MRLTQKLLSFLNRVFDKDPAPFLALRLRYDGGMTWRVADGVLTTTVTGGSGEDLVVDLSQYRIGELINHLAAQPGYEIAYGDQTTLSLLSALVLMDGSGDIDKSNGDHLYGYTSILWSYLEAQASELQAAAAQIPEALAQMSTKTAQGEWLDELGDYYDVPRIQGENDASYGPRIIAEVLRPRGNNVAMQAAIKIFTGQDALVTDVTLYGDTFPLYDGAIQHNGLWQYNAEAQPIYGLFDVQYGYDFINGGDITQFHEIVRGLVGRLRDAGTHLRSLQLRGSDLVDTFTSPPNDGGPIQWQAGAAFVDTLDAPSDPQFDLAGSLGAMSDSFVVPLDGVGLKISYDYRYNGVRSYDGTIAYMGGITTVENVGTPGDIPFDVLLRTDGSHIADGSEIADGLL